MPTPRLLAAGVLCALAAYAVPTPLPAQDEALDYEAVRAALPTMTELSAAGHEMAKRLHETVDKLAKAGDEPTRKQLRGELRTALVAYRENKLRMIEVTRPLLRLPQVKMTDTEVLERLQGTELRGIEWNDTFFDKCMRDLSGALKIPIRLQARVVKKNQVSMSFAKAPAEMILASLCNGFDLRYVIHDGEIVIYKKIGPTEERFIAYKERHPGTELRYWEQEDASGDVTKKGGK